MAVNVFPTPVVSSKIRYQTTLLSGTSYTVPAGVTSLTVTCVGGGAANSSGTINNGGSTSFTGATTAAGGSNSYTAGIPAGNGSSVNTQYTTLAGDGQVTYSTVSTSGGSAITYAIGAAGSSPAGSGAILVEYWL